MPKKKKPANKEILKEIEHLDAILELTLRSVKKDGSEADTVLRNQAKRIFEELRVFKEKL